jgi:hypothetical protein
MARPLHNGGSTLMRHGALYSSIVSVTVLAACLGGCGKSHSPGLETAQAAGKYLQEAGVYQPGKLTVVPAKELQTYGDSVVGNAAATYTGVVWNVFSPYGDEPAIWQFQNAKEPDYAFDGDPPPIASVGGYVFLCGPLLVIGDTKAKVEAVHGALAKHYSDCRAVIPAPPTTN